MVGPQSVQTLEKLAWVGCRALLSVQTSPELKFMVVTDTSVSLVWRLEYVVGCHVGVGANLLYSYQISGTYPEKFNPFSFFLLLAPVPENRKASF